MNELAPDPTPNPIHDPTHDAPDARVHTRRPFHFVWLVPIVAALIAGFLAWRAIVEGGPTITISFSTADGLTAGQTKIRHKAVDLGTVHAISLAKNMTHVEVRADMRGEASLYLTDQARFWVVRPRLTAGNISGLDTLLSGSYIEMDPGEAGGTAATQFTGLEEPPAVRSDEPGRAFVLQADRIGSLSSGSPVFYHDIVAGEVLGYDVHATEKAANPSIAVHVFIRAPYDQFVHEGTHFWNASGVSVEFGAQGVQVRLESLQAALSGGIAFDTPADARSTAVSPANAKFTLYSNESGAAAAGYRQRVPFLVYFQGSVRGLAVGAPVELFGIQIGTVTAINLEFDPSGRDSRVAVRLEVQPERIMRPEQVREADPIDISRRMVEKGMRVQLRSANYLTGQLIVAFDFFSGATAATVEQAGDAVVLPSVPGGLDSITTNVGQILQKIDGLPLDEIARNLNETLADVRSVASGAELKQSLQSLSATMAAVQDLVHKADTDMGPALKRLPDIAQTLQAAVERASKLLGSADLGYGENSQFRRDLQRVLEQVSDTARSVRLLADYLDQHPEALLRGRSGRLGDR
jgi:paraquat-inducible protein B